MMKPFTPHDNTAAAGGAESALQDSEYIEHRSVLFEDLPDSRSGREQINGSAKRSHSKSSKTATGRGSAQTAERTSTTPEAFSDTINGNSIAGTVLPTGSSSSSAIATAAGDATGPPLSHGVPTVETLQSTLLRLKTRKLPVGPLPKMDEVIARFMNISPKQWQLLNSTIDELNGRFKQGALHWLLLRWLVAAHPEQFFPPPFNSYQHLLQQVSQKDAEVEEARKEATKWRHICVRLEAERERWKQQLQQMEEEVSELYTALAERQDSVDTKEVLLKQQPTQQHSDASGDTADMLPAPGDASKARAQEPEQQHIQLQHGGQQQQRQNQTQHHHPPQHHPPQQHTQRQELKQQQFPEDLREHDDHKEKQHGALLLPQLAHPVSCAESALCCDQPAGVDEAHREREKQDGNSSVLPCATTTTKTKTTVTTTTKSSTTSAHSVCVTKDTDAALPSSVDPSKQQLPEIQTRKTSQHVCETGRAGDEVSLASVLACVQNLLRRLTAENTDAPVFSTSRSPSLREGEDTDCVACTSPVSRDLTKRQGRKVQKKNVELWYLQYEQQNGLSAGLDDKKKKKLQVHQEKRDRDKKKKHQEHRKGPHPQELDQDPLKEEDEQEQEEQLQHRTPPEEGKSDDSLVAVCPPRPEAELAGGTGLDSQQGDTGTDGLEVQQNQVNVPCCSPSSTSKPPAPSSSDPNALTSQPTAASAGPEQLSSEGDLLHISQHTNPVKAYIRRFLALYRGGERIPETIATRIFIDRLKPDLKQYVQSRHPSSLAHAILLARQAERTAAPFAVPTSSVKIRTRDPSAHDSCGEPAQAKMSEWCATKRHDGADEENEGTHSNERDLKDCRRRGTASCVDSQRALSGHHRCKSYLPRNEPATSTRNATRQWQQPQHEIRQAQQSRVQHQQEQQLVEGFDAEDGDIWHSSDDTIHSNDGDFETPTARRNLQQQRYEDEQQHQKVATPQEKTYVIPRPGKTKQNTTERTHVVRRVFTGSGQRVLPRDS